MRPKLVTYLTAVSTALATEVLATGASFTTEGVLTHRFFWDGTSVEQRESRVKVQVDPPRWLIETQLLGTNRPTRHHVMSYDGEAFFSFSEEEPRQGLTNVIRSCLVFRDVGHGLESIESSGADFLLFTFAPELWRASTTEHLAGCIWADPALRTQKKMRIFIGVSDIGTLTKREAVWVNDGTIFPEGDRSPRGERWPAPFNVPFTNAIFSATLTQSNKVPLVATLTTMVPEIPSCGPKQGLAIEEEYEFCTLNEYPICRISRFRPSLPARTTLMDLRLFELDHRFHPTCLVNDNEGWTIAPLEQLTNQLRTFALEKRHAIEAAASKGHLGRARVQLTIVTILMSMTFIALMTTHARNRRN